MSEPLGPITYFPGKGGLNLHDDAEGLEAPETIDLNDVYPLNGACLKRPGLTKAHDDAVILTAHIYDMKRFAMLENAFGSLLPDALYCLYGTNPVKLAVFDPTVGSLVDLGDIDPAPGAADANHERELAPAGRDMIHITACTAFVGPGYTVGNARRLEHDGVSFVFNAQTSPYQYRTAVWHRDHLMMADSAIIFAPGLGPGTQGFGWSATGDPRTLPNNNAEDLRPYGWLGTVNGIVSAGDIAYFLKDTESFALTGDVEENWEAERLIGIGAFGTRSVAILSGGLVMGLGVAPAWLNGGVLTPRMRAYPNNIFAAKGFNVEWVGHKVAPLIEAAYAFDSARTLSLETKDRKAVFWETRSLTCFFLKVPFAATNATTAVVHHLDRNSQEQTWWKWTFGTAVKPNAFEHHNRTVYIGCGDGRIRYLNESAADDDGTAMDPYFTFRVWGPKRNHKYSIEDITISGFQGSGSNPMQFFHAANNEAFPGTAQKTIDLSLKTIAMKLSADSTIKQGRSHNLKFKFGANAVGAGVRWIAIHLKDLGAI